MKTFYTIKSVSEDGVYYLCNHWEKNKMFWMEEKQIRSYRLFTSPGQAKGSLTKLLKVMPEYENYTFSVVSIEM